MKKKKKPAADLTQPKSYTLPKGVIKATASRAKELDITASAFVTRTLKKELGITDARS